MPDSIASPPFTAHVFAPKRSDYCIVVGVLNEGERIRRQVLALQPYAELADIIIADGGSADGGTEPEFLRGRVRALLVSRSAQRGLSVQHRIAFAYAMSEGYAGVVVMDGNGKDGVEAIPHFVRALEGGFDMVQGSRFLPGGGHEHTPPDRLLAIRYIFNPLMARASGFPYTDAINGFKAQSRRYLLHPGLQPFRDVFEGYSLQYYLNYRAARLGCRIAEIPVTRNYPAHAPAPSKIGGLRGRLSILRQLLGVIAGRYDPPAPPAIF